jgi:hypothetical protein
MCLLDLHLCLADQTGCLLTSHERGPVWIGFRGDAIQWSSVATMSRPDGIASRSESPNAC